VERYSDCGTVNVCNCEWTGTVTVEQAMIVTVSGDCGTVNVCDCEWGGTVTVKQLMFVTVSGEVQ